VRLRLVVHGRPVPLSRSRTRRGRHYLPTRSRAYRELVQAEWMAAARIKRDIALAALTPDLADDKARAAELVSFLERVLGEAQAEPAARGGDETIAQLAEALQTAKSNAASLTGSGTNENADLQAQIDQQKARAEVERQRAEINEQALQVFKGAGDIGSGSGSSRVVINQTVNTLHPTDPRTLEAIGKAATMGIDYQGGRSVPRVQVGP
jgi:hypothetical protein